MARRSFTLVELLVVIVIIATLISLLLPAVLISGGAAIAIIGVRAITLVSFWRALGGIVFPAAAIMAITLGAAVWPQLQGILLTGGALALFIAAMTLMPKVAAAGSNFWGLPTGPALRPKAPTA